MGECTSCGDYVPGNKGGDCEDCKKEQPEPAKPEDPCLCWVDPLCCPKHAA